MTLDPRFTAVKRIVPTPLKSAIRSGGRALYDAPPSRRLPPRGYRLEDYKRWFPRSAEIFLRYLKNSDLQPVVPDRPGSIAVVVMPWVSTVVPWYATTLGLGLLDRGWEVEVLWDDTGFSDLRVGLQNEYIDSVLDLVKRVMP